VVAAGLCRRIVAPRRSRSWSRELTLANVLGVPLGHCDRSPHSAGVRRSGRYRHSRDCAWRDYPAGAPNPAEPDRQGGWTILRRPHVLLALALTVVGFGGIFTAFTYITPMLQDLAGFSPKAVSGILFLFGVGLTLGNMLGGRLADWKPTQSMLGIPRRAGPGRSLLSVTITASDGGSADRVRRGCGGLRHGPGLQMRVVDQARESPMLASTLNIAAFNLGNAGGAWLGGRLIDAHLPAARSAAWARLRWRSSRSRSPAPESRCGRMQGKTDAKAFPS